MVDKLTLALEWLENGHVIIDFKDATTSACQHPPLLSVHLKELRCSSRMLYPCVKYKVAPDAQGSIKRCHKRSLLLPLPLVHIGIKGSLCCGLRAEHNMEL